MDELLAVSGHGGASIVQTLNANIYGNGTQTLVLSPGYGTDQSVWHFMLPYLACYFKVVVFDLIFSPNVNPSFYDPNKYSSFNGYAEDLVNILDELNVNNAIYMGHSMSAMIGCYASIKRADLFQHLVLLDGSPRYLNENGYGGGFEMEQLNKIFDQMGKNYSSWVQSFAPTAVGMNNTEAIKEFENSLGRMKPEIAISVAKTVFLSDYRKVLPKVVVPCTIIQSENDPIVPNFVAYYMMRHLPGNPKVEMIRTEGHFPHLTAYRQVLQVLERVLPIN